MKKLLIANWKMNPNTREEAEALAGSLVGSAPNPEKVEVVLTPSFLHISIVARTLAAAQSNLKVGAQDAFWEGAGAFTGEVSPQMLKNSTVSHVLVGHSERRKWLNETNEMINKKIEAVCGADLTAVLCVGEPQSVRSGGLEEAKKFIKKELGDALKNLSEILSSNARLLVVAYEPIWAIGTGVADKPADTAEMSRFIKETLGFMGIGRDIPVLYGGSVTAENAASFFTEPDIDGALVGRSGLNAEEFRKIIDIASK